MARAGAGSRSAKTSGRGGGSGRISAGSPNQRAKNDLAKAKQSLRNRKSEKKAGARPGTLKDRKLTNAKGAAAAKNAAGKQKATAKRAAVKAKATAKKRAKKRASFG